MINDFSTMSLILSFIEWSPPPK